MQLTKKEKHSGSEKSLQSAVLEFCDLMIMLVYIAIRRFYGLYETCWASNKIAYKWKYINLSQLPVR